MGRKKVTCDDIVKMRELYAELGTYAAVARAVGYSASTVRKYIIEDVKIETEVKNNVSAHYEGKVKNIEDIPLSFDLSHYQVSKNVNGFVVSESFSHKKYYFISVSFDFGFIFSKYVRNGYNELIAKLLFDLDYEQYLLMMQDNFNASIVGEENRYILFKNKNDAEKAIKEFNYRLNYLLQKGEK